MLGDELLDLQLSHHLLLLQVGHLLVHHAPAGRGSARHMFISSVVDPDPDVFGPPGSGCVSQKQCYESGSECFWASWIQILPGHFCAAIELLYVPNRQ